MNTHICVSCISTHIHTCKHTNTQSASLNTPPELSRMCRKEDAVAGRRRLVYALLPDCIDAQHVTL